MLLVVNPAAGGGRVRRRWERVLPTVEERLRGVAWVWSEGPGHATELARSALDRGVRRVAAVGGDGTAVEVAAALVGRTDACLGIVPMGTGNDAARTFGIPLRLEDALDTLAGGRPRPVDVVWVGEHPAINAVGIGLTGAVNLWATRMKLLPGLAAYLVTALGGLFAYRSPTVRMVSDGASWQGTMTMLAVHNGPTTGGGFRLTPAARPDDGRLDACLVPGVHPLGRLTRLVAGLRGTLGRFPDTVELVVPRFELEHDVPLPAHVDGNQVELAPPRTVFEVAPGALRVLVPGDAAGG